MLKLRELFITDQQRSVAKATDTIEDIQRDLRCGTRLSREVTNLLSVTGSKALREVKEQIT
jgi:hypothetical protein